MNVFRHLNNLEVISLETIIYYDFSKTHSSRNFKF